MPPANRIPATLQETVFPACRTVAGITAVGIAVVALCIVGCQKKPPDYKPPLKLSESAVSRVMEAWKQGLSDRELRGTPTIIVTDNSRKKGQILDRFEILGEVRGSVGRTIAVKLNLSNPNEEVKLRYITIGIDPLLVYRQEDYELLMHWDHWMPEKPADSSPQVSPDEAPADALSVLNVE